jgi:hypothetical protein
VHAPSRGGGPFPNCYRLGGIVSRLPSVSTSVSNSLNNKHAFLDRTDNPYPVRHTEPEPVSWWIPLVASTGALLVLVLGTAAVISEVVNATISGIG